MSRPSEQDAAYDVYLAGSGGDADAAQQQRAAVAGGSAAPSGPRRRPWRPGSVTGLGSLPGTDPGEAARLIFGELPDLPHLAELPERGAGADLIGRTAALLVDLAVEIVPSGWRIAAHPGRDQRRARDLLAWDLDALEAAGAGHAGSPGADPSSATSRGAGPAGVASGVVKVQASGPWTLAAGLELPGGHKVVSDHGAVRDLADSLAEGLRLHLADVARRLPRNSVILQLDEPSLPSVLAGQVATPSGWGTVRAVDRALARQRLGDVLRVADAGCRVVHCCAPEAPVHLLRDAGADAISLDLSLLTTSSNDALGEAIDAGGALWLGLVPGTDAQLRFAEVRARLLDWWSQLGFHPGQLAGCVVPTPRCGLAGASPGYVRHAMSVLREVGRSLLETD